MVEADCALDHWSSLTTVSMTLGGLGCKGDLGMISVLGCWQANAYSLTVGSEFSEGCTVLLYILPPAALRIPALQSCTQNACIKALFLFPFPGASFMIEGLGPLLLLLKRK